MVMSKLDRVKPSRRSQLESLLFSGAMLATTALVLGTLADPKLPPFRGTWT
jgi:hypothetical protein